MIGIAVYGLPGDVFDEIARQAVVLKKQVTADVYIAFNEHALEVHSGETVAGLHRRFMRMTSPRPTEQGR